MRDFLLSVIIPTYNNIKGINCLLNYFKGKPYQIIVVDNNIKVKKFESYKVKKLKNLVYLTQKENLGFAKAINLGAKYVKSKWMVILNDDIEFKNQKSKIKNQNDNSKLKNIKSAIIEKLIDFAEKNKLDALSLFWLILMARLRILDIKYCRMERFN